jgi:hypothetical protein
MKKLWTSVALAVSALTLTVSAQAGVMRTVIDFETPITQGVADYLPYLTHDNIFLQPAAYDRSVYFNPFSTNAAATEMDLVGYVGNGADCGGTACPTNNSGTYVSTLNDAVMSFGFVDGSRFSLKSFKAAFIGNDQDATMAVPAVVRMRGVIGASTFDFMAWLSGPDAQGALGFATYTTDAAYANRQFDYVLAYGFACATSGSGCTAFNTNRAQFALDDIVVEQLPEPASLALLGLAGVAAFAARRRRAA